MTVLTTLMKFLGAWSPQEIRLKNSQDNFPDEFAEKFVGNFLKIRQTKITSSSQIHSAEPRDRAIPQKSKHRKVTLRYQPQRCKQAMKKQLKRSFSLSFGCTPTGVYRNGVSQGSVQNGAFLCIFAIFFLFFTHVFVQPNSSLCAPAEAPRWIFLFRWEILQEIWQEFCGDFFADPQNIRLWALFVRKFVAQNGSFVRKFALQATLKTRLQQKLRAFWDSLELLCSRPEIAEFSYYAVMRLTGCGQAKATLFSRKIFVAKRTWCSAEIHSKKNNDCNVTKCLVTRYFAVDLPESRWVAFLLLRRFFGLWGLAPKAQRLTKFKISLWDWNCQARTKIQASLFLVIFENLTFLIQEGNGNGNFGKLIQMTFKMMIGNRCKRKGWLWPPRR